MQIWKPIQNANYIMDFIIHNAKLHVRLYNP